MSYVDPGSGMGRDKELVKKKKKNRNQRGTGKEQGMPGSRGMREMSEVICGPRGVSAGSSAGFNLNKWPSLNSGKGVNSEGGEE